MGNVVAWEGHGIGVQGTDDFGSLSSQGLKRLIISGSPFANGKTEKVAQKFQKQLSAAGMETEVFYLSRLSVAGCLGCNLCSDFELSSLSDYACVIEDDMTPLAQKLGWCDELLVVSPVFFSGVPSQLKAVYDRLQPYFWHKELRREKRPFDLAILGEGGDPYGYGAFVSESRSALAMAGFSLREIYDCVHEQAEDCLSDDDDWCDGKVEIGK